MQEWLALAGLPPEAGVDEGVLDAWQDEIGVPLAAALERFRLARRQDRWHVAERGKRVAKAAAYVGWNDELSEALERAGPHWGRLVALGQEGMSKILEAVPTIHATSELQRQRESATDKP